MFSITLTFNATYGYYTIAVVFSAGIWIASAVRNHPREYKGSVLYIFVINIFLLLLAAIPTSNGEFIMKIMCIIYPIAAIMTYKQKI